MGHDYFNGFTTAMDRNYYHQLDSLGDVYHPAALHDDHPKTKLGPRELGQSANPFQSQLLALQARIREGASSIEFQFPGRGKGSAQASTPESYGDDEREAMRQLAEYNDVRTSTHATFSVSGLAGWGQQGFSREAQHQNMEEVRKAVDFAAQASTGGAIVVHTGEWQRPMTEPEWSRKDFEKDFKGAPAFRAYADEERQAAYQVVDGTGNVISGIRKDWGVKVPRWMTKKQYEEEHGSLPYRDVEGNPVKQYADDDLVDNSGRLINPTDLNQLKYRVPVYNESLGQFETVQLQWEDLQRQAEHWNKRWGKDFTTEELLARSQFDTQILQARGNAQYHARGYEDARDRLDKFREALRFVSELDRNLPESEKHRLMRTHVDPYVANTIGPEFAKPESKHVMEILSERIKDAERDLRYIQESASSSDVQADMLIDRTRDIQSLEKYGLKETGKALGQLGVYAMEKSKAMKEQVKKQGGNTKKYEDLYIAPENVFPGEYGSHPDELIKIVESGRKSMADELMSKNRVKSREEAEEIAKKHIKSTIDIGHLNMWKTNMVRKDNETDEQFNKRFEKWMLEKLDTMHKKGVLGHFHLTDNMGFNDEHLTPGQGNAPIRSFMHFLEKNGYKDFIIEQSGFNDRTILGETWSYLGALQTTPGAYGAPTHFNKVHMHQSGAYMPPLAIVGGYVPSNEWTFWSQVPLE